MVQTWHTFKKFSLPSPNPLHCKRGWHVPNETEAIVSENSPPLSGIVSPKTTRSHSWGKRYSRGCYATPAAMWFPENLLFVGHTHSIYSFLMQMAQSHFPRIQPKIDRISSPMKRKEAQTTHVFGFVSWKLAMFLAYVILGLESKPLRLDEEWKIIKGINYICLFVRGERKDMATRRSFDYGHGENMIRHNIW